MREPARDTPARSRSTAVIIFVAMRKKTVTIINKLGLHARAAAQFVQSAAAFEADIDVTANGKIVNGKSIMGLMMLAVAKGTTIELTISGRDEEEAMMSLEKLILQRFGEEE